VTDTRRKTLTPLTGELRAAEPPTVTRPGRLSTLRRRRSQRPLPTTTLGALAQGLKRLGVALWAAAIVALLIDKYLLPGRDPGIGFYIVGAIVSGSTLASANGGGSRLAYARGAEREQRVNYAFAYFLVGILILVIGGLIEAFAPSWQL
jgi:hypothetical protein